MGVPSYVCADCGQMFTRRYSATRHNFNMHRNGAEIVGTIQYMTGVSNGRYQPPPALTRRARVRGGQTKPNFDYIIPGSPPDPLMSRVARDSGDIAITNNNFRPDVLQGQAPYNSYLQQHRDQIRSGQSQSSSLRQHTPYLPSSFDTNQNQNQNIPPSPSVYPTTTAAATDQSQSQPAKTGSNSWRISEDAIPKIVELRRLLYRHNIPNPDIIIQVAKHFCTMGDNSFLEEKLAYLRSVDAITQQPGQDNDVV